ncbi:MAG: hypothetical protein AAF750_11190 [Planctomycetota bacterium]
MDVIRTVGIKRKLTLAALIVASTSIGPAENPGMVRMDTPGTGSIVVSVRSGETVVVPFKEGWNVTQPLAVSVSGLAPNIWLATDEGPKAVN